jgi:hypothetical protein
VQRTAAVQAWDQRKMKGSTAVVKLDASVFKSMQLAWQKGWIQKGADEDPGDRGTWE